MGAPVLQSKNLTILEDQLNHEALAAKKAAYYAQSITDANLKGMADQLAMHHRQRFDRLLSYLNSHQ